MLLAKEGVEEKSVFSLCFRPCSSCGRFVGHVVGICADTDEGCQGGGTRLNNVARPAPFSRPTGRARSRLGCAAAIADMVGAAAAVARAAARAAAAVCAAAAAVVPAIIAAPGAPGNKYRCRRGHPSVVATSTGTVAGDVTNGVPTPGDAAPNARSRYSCALLSQRAGKTSV